MPDKVTLYRRGRTNADSAPPDGCYRATARDHSEATNGD